MDHRLLKRRFIDRTIVTLTVATIFSMPVLAQEAQTKGSADAAYKNPWAFNLSLYLWLPGARGDFTAGPVSRSVNSSFVDIADQSRRFPLGFMGRFEAHYDRLAFYLDGNYMNLELKPKLDRISQGVNSDVGIMDYTVAYRVLGPSAAELPGILGKKNANWLEVFAGGRTVWLENSVDFNTPFGNPRNGPRSFSSSKSFTSPVVGGRFMLGITPSWFMLVDGNIGGFGVDNVQFTAGGLGAIGYRTRIWDLGTSFEAGYKALYYDVDSGGAIATKATLHGPFIGITGYW